MNEHLSTFTSLVPILSLYSGIVIALVKVLTTAGMQKRFAFLADIFLGVLIYWLVPINNVSSPKEIIFYGIIVGLVASGLYSGTKSTFLQKEEPLIQKEIIPEI